MADPNSDPTSERLLVALRAARARAQETSALLRAGQRPEAAAANTRNAAEAERAYLSSLGAWLHSDPGNDISRLTAEYPIALLPVRIETRFGNQVGKPCLRVRVYPDEIAADSHEPELTITERDAGTSFWTTAWDPTQEMEAWRALVAFAGATRAAWIARVLTPTNLAARPAGAPLFPAVDLKSATWSRPVTTSVLPDRWVVACVRGGAVVRRGAGRPIPEPLTVTVSPAIDPNDTAGVTDISGDGLMLDNALLWTVQFDRAEAIGMGIVLSIDGTDLAQGFDRVLVYGVKASLAPAEGGARLQGLLGGHHYSRGLALVQQGTPTNNTGAAASGFPAPDPNAAVSFAVERGDTAAIAGSDGEAFARAVGVPAVADHIAGAGRIEQKAARAMNQALWPATWGYFLDQLLDPVVPVSAVDQTRAFYVAWVRGRGPLPAFRVGSVPYGLLPVSSLLRWQPRRAATALGRFLPGLLRKLRPYWLGGVAGVPRAIAADGDPDQALLDILAEDASAREVWVRPLVGPDAATNLATFAGIAWSARLAAQSTQVSRLQDLWNGGVEIPRVATAVFQPGSARFRFALVSALLSETEALDFNYLRWLRTATPADLRAERVPDGVPKPVELLYRLARHGLLLGYRRAALDLIDQVGALDVGERREPEFVGIVPGTEDRKTIWNRLDAPLAGVGGGAPLGEYLHGLVVSPAATGPTTATSTLADQVGALTLLESLPTAELDRLFTETLDTCAHRLDAWITALATERLAELRAARPQGIHLGAFGFVENLRPVAAPAERRLEDGRTVSLQAGNGGFIHAPSMTHAATAAVLRNGYLSRSGPGQERYALDLSSDRIRAARWLLGGMREGQSLRGLLGYQFERGLHERQLEKYIEPLRQLYPQPDLDLPAAPDVVDGLALRAAADAGQIPFGANPDLPSADPDLAGVKAELAALDETFDAVSDLLTAEGVHQLVRGTTMGASASMDAQARGVRPPDPEIARVPRGGVPLTHRVALVLGGDPPPDAWSGLPATPRSTTEPWLDRWLAALIGDPSTVRCRVATPGPHRGDPDVVQTVSLVELGLRPLDLLPLVDGGGGSVALDARNANPLADGSDLDRRIVVAAFGWTPPATCRVLYAPDAGWLASGIRTLPAILELLRAARDLIGKARPLAPADVILPEVDLATSGADGLSTEADARAAQALGALVQLEAALTSARAAVPDPAPGDPEPDLTGLRAAVIRAAGYGATSFPPLPLPTPAGERLRLVAAADAALRDLAGRIAAANASTGASARIAAIFGAGFPFLPRFLPGNAAGLQQALGAGGALVPNDAVKRQWLQQLERVRAQIGLWQRVARYARCIGTPVPPFDLAQLPYEAGAQWVGLPFTPDKAPAARRTSLALFNPATPPSATQPWAGLMIDEWTEIIPSTEETTGVGFHYDDPGAEAAQAVLLAVCPTNAPQWDADSLEAVLLETFDLAQIRAVHADVPASVGVPGVPDLSQLLPAIYLASNAAGDTVGTSFDGARINQAQVAFQSE
ncbi:hypothetical protein V1290_000361 [Bradyrhizobium sp. AZCC 1578]|uniref:hypothetical protein n=1 Tax=Bradyrhizobium sp. AZCC 1578 TaxID=3117027 RepID=UPI002FF20164